MNNAEWCIKNGIKFTDIEVRLHGTSSRTGICDYEIRLRPNRRVIGEISLEFGYDKDYIFQKWLDVEHHDEPILDDAEKRYLGSVIRPWRERVRYIVRYESGNHKESWLVIEMNGENETHMPYFKTGTMYTGMKASKYYTLEEMGL